MPRRKGAGDEVEGMRRVFQPAKALRRTLALSLASAALGGCVATGPATPPPPLHPNGQALWKIISDKCLPDQLQHQDPAPCALVSVDGGTRRGFVILKDRNGATQHLLMPTDKVTGIEDPKVLAADAPNYFAQAWDARGYVETRLGKVLAREEVAVAVNSIYGRSQDQLHLHIDCLDAGVRAALRHDAPQIGRGWSTQTFMLAGHPYRIMRIDGAGLGQASPFRLLADGLPGARRNMGAWTLVLVGAPANDGAPGFYLIAGRADPAAGEYASGESLQDHACKDMTGPR